MKLKVYCYPIYYEVESLYIEAGKNMDKVPRGSLNLDEKVRFSKTKDIVLRDL